MSHVLNYMFLFVSFVVLRKDVFCLSRVFVLKVWNERTKNHITFRNLESGHSCHCVINSSHVML